MRGVAAQLRITPIDTTAAETNCESGEISVRCAALLSRRVISESSGYGKWQQRARLGIGSALSSSTVLSDTGTASGVRQSCCRGGDCFAYNPNSLCRSHSLTQVVVLMEHPSVTRSRRDSIPMLLLPSSSIVPSRQLRISNTSVVALVGMVCDFFHPNILVL